MLWPLEGRLVYLLFDITSDIKWEYYGFTAERNNFWPVLPTQLGRIQWYFFFVVEVVSLLWLNDHDIYRTLNRVYTYTICVCYGA